MKDIVEASLLGDYSKYSKPTKESRELATILDILTSDTHIAGSASGNLSPAAIDGVISNPKKKSELIAYGENRVAELLDNAFLGIKVHKADRANIYIADFEKIRGNKEERYPLPGRFASRLMDKIEELNGNEVRAVVVLHFGPFISLRLSKLLSSENFNLLEIVQKIKEVHGSEIESGGGHFSAASIKLSREESKKNVITDVVEELKKKLSAS